MNRRDFLIHIGQAALVGPIVAQWTGGGDESPDPDATGPGPDAARTDGPVPMTDAALPDTSPGPDAIPDASLPACSNGTNTTIGNNHGHDWTVPAADVQAGVEQTYNIRGTSPHPHTVTLTAAHFQMLRDGQMLTLISSTDSNHSHTVTIGCL